MGQLTEILRESNRVDDAVAVYTYDEVLARQIEIKRLRDHIAELQRTLENLENGAVPCGPSYT